MIPYADLLGNPWESYTCSAVVRVALNRWLPKPLSERDLPTSDSDGARALQIAESDPGSSRWVPVSHSRMGDVLVTRDAAGVHVFLDLGNELALSSSRSRGVYATGLPAVRRRATHIYRPT